MRGEAWTVDEDAIIRAEVAAGRGWIVRCAPRLSHRTVAAIQVRASTLRATLRPAASPPPEPAREFVGAIVSGEPRIPDFLADSPAFNR